MPTLQVLLLGPPLIQREARPIQLSERKATALLAYLALSPTVRGRDELAALLWPEHPKSRDRLRHALWVVRKAVGEKHLIIEREIIGLRQDEDTVTDVMAFRKLLAANQGHGHTAREVCDRCLEPLGAATELYRGDFLSGFSLADSPPFDDWQSFESESLSQELGDALGRLIRLHNNRGEFETAINYCRRRLTLDPLNEPAQRELMRVYAWAARAPLALRQYEEFVALLDEEIGVPPEQETIDLADAIRTDKLPTPKTIRRIERSEVSSTGGLIAKQRGVVQNLPGTLGSLVGRRHELDELVGLLRDEPDCRLLTLVGLGGVGKTSLAIQVAVEAAAYFEQGAVFVPLTEVDDDAHLPLDIAGALDTPIRGSGDLSQQLVNFLRERELLLVLDNFEQLLAGNATELLAQLLAGAGRIKLLVTSRERLKLSDEWGYELDGLLYPESGAIVTRSLEDYSAVQLFLRDMRRARPGLALAEKDGRHVLRICRLVEGLPLALKLAAGWSRIMTVRRIADEIEGSPDFLESTLRDIPDRHQNIRAVFNHSWALLSNAEREAFMKLSVFRGGFSSRAAERVAGASPRMLLRLADKSLIQRSGDGRFQIHKLLRRYASEHLEERPTEREMVQDAHADYYATFLARRQEAIHGVSQEKILAELAAEHDNIRAAWNRSCTKGIPALLERGAECLVQYLIFATRFQEGRMLCRQGVHSLENVIAKHGAEDDQNRVYKLALAQLLIGQAMSGHPDEAQRLGEESVRLFRAIKPVPKRQLAGSLMRLGSINLTRGEYASALTLLTESVELYREIGDKTGEGHSRVFIGSVESYRGNYRAGQDFLRESTRLLEEAGNRRIGYFAQWSLGSVARTTGDFEEARRLLDESMRFAQSVQRTPSLVFILREVSQLALDLGNEYEARRCLQQGLKLSTETNAVRLAGFFHVGLGVVARRERNFDEARQEFNRGMDLFRESSEPRGVGIGLQNMGDLAYDEGCFADAEEFYRRSLSQFEAIEHRLGVASALCGLGEVLALDPQQHGVAHEHFQRALSLAEEMGTTPVSLDALVGLASLASQEELSLEQAAEWVGQVLSHPAGKHETKKMARKLLADLAREMGRERVDEAVQRGEAKELDEILAEALSLQTATIPWRDYR